MKLIKPSFRIISEIDGRDILRRIENAGRTCYKSENRITETSSVEFVKMIIKNGHESVLEHQSISVKIICDRGVSHELVRHRIASFSQESTRYCNYSKDKFSNQITFIIPCWFDKEIIYKVLNDPIAKGDGKSVSINVDLKLKDFAETRWVNHMLDCEKTYKALIISKWSPQQARSVLPNSLKTEIVITANLREWRLIFKQRTAQAAHPQMREIMQPMLDEFKIKIPVIFDDINYA